MTTQVHAKHILVKTEEEASSILFDLKRGASFEEIAQAKSICPSKKMAEILVGLPEIEWLKNLKRLHSY